MPAQKDGNLVAPLLSTLGRHFIHPEPLCYYLWHGVASLIVAFHPSIGSECLRGHCIIRCPEARPLVLDFDQVKGVSLVKQERPKHRAHLAVAPMLTQDVSRVVVSSNVVKQNHLGGYSFARVVTRKSMVAL